MNFNYHPELEGRHAFLSASKSHWVNYDEEKLDRTFLNALAAQKGTAQHNYAAMAIKLGMKQPRTNKTICKYVNDAIGFKMTPEQVLFYSLNAFGTADAISFRDNVLRIHDLKTGSSTTMFRQLEVYAAFFCLEYMVKPHEIEIIMAIYQNDDVKEAIANPVDVANIMERIVIFDERINTIKKEVLL
jgi:Protein of unknown function (DUF2800).